MKRFLIVFLFVMISISLFGQMVLAADGVNVDRNLVAKISLKISNMNTLNKEQKQELQERVLEMVYENQLNPEEVLNGLDSVQTGNQSQSTQEIQMMIMAQARGVDQELLEQTRARIGSEEMKGLAEEVNNALAEGVDGESVNEILRDRDRLKDSDQIKDAIRQAVHEQEQKKDAEYQEKDIDDSHVQGMKDDENEKNGDHDQDMGKENDDDAVSSQAMKNDKKDDDQDHHDVMKADDRDKDGHASGTKDDDHDSGTKDDDDHGDNNHSHHGHEDNDDD